MEVRNPADDALLACVPNCGARDAAACVDAAHRALGAWRRAAASARADVLGAAARLLRERRGLLAATITAENGKPLDEAAGEVDYSADYLDSAAREACELHDEPIDARGRPLTRRAIPEPIGVVAAITPWNFPLAMLARKTAPALAVGCTQVVKPAEATPLSALAFAEVMRDAGLPAGVVNVVTGDPVAISDAWLSDGRVRALSFTGSTEIGKDLMRRAAPQVVRLSLELGGLAPLIVCDDADLNAAVAATIAGKFRCAGQTCICPNRILVARGIAREFASRLASAADALPVGRPEVPGTRIGPLIDNRAVDKARRHVADAIERGASVLCGGATVKVPECVDRFFAPTVIEGATTDMLCFREETFGPIAPVAAFDSECGAIELANATPYGLAAYIFAGNSDRARQMATELRYGIVGINTCAVSDAYSPFGGCGWSGFGREGGRWGLDEYLSWKLECAAAPHS